MLDIGGWELLMIAAVALIVVGPKDLPGLVRNVGRWVSKARGLAREFQSGMEAAAKEADVDEFRQIGSLKSDLQRQVRDMGRRAQGMIDDIDEAPQTRRERDAGRGGERSSERPSGERIEPGFDQQRSGSRYAERPPRRREERYEERYDRPGADHGFDDDEALERFQTGMRRRD